ncbi:MAG TPA: hypothetical protein PKV01_09050 [Anaerolineales bacterium]|nr:hypothetical protein [Anaerolineales bacterium]
MVTDTVIIPKSMHNVLSRLTGQSRSDIALSLAIKDLVRLRLNETRLQISGFEKKYGMTYAEFEKACDNGTIQDPYSYEVEKDDREWEAALTDLKALEELSQWLV